MSSHNPPAATTGALAQEASDAFADAVLELATL
jgi:hypothetical protein